MLTTKIIGQKIAEARKKINLSQAALAEHLFISSQAVGKWERGESMPDLITFNRLAELLGVDLNYFSENFPSSLNIEAQSESQVNKSAEIPTQNKKFSGIRNKKKLTWDMSHGNWVDAEFSGLKNLHEKFSASNMQRCLFIGSDLSELLLKNNHVEGCDFSASNIFNSHWQGSYLSNNKFINSSLREAVISGSHIKDCNFSGANFTGVAFKSGVLTHSMLEKAVWRNTIFTNMQLGNLVFEGTLEDCSFENCAFDMITFKNARIINTFFKNKSLKRIRFIDCQADKLTYEFLKLGKANLNGISLVID
ncbi:MAG: pentapeptide repeat-containing protein [Salinivirgaceae bacterium]